jgi:hypothetical protein
MLKSRRHPADGVTPFKDALLFQQLLDPLFPARLAITSPTERASLPGLHKLDASAIVVTRH